MVPKLFFTHTPDVTWRCTMEGYNRTLEILVALQIVLRQTDVPGEKEQDKVVAMVTSAGAKLSDGITATHPFANVSGVVDRDDVMASWLQVTIPEAGYSYYGTYFCKIVYVELLADLGNKEWYSEAIHFTPSATNARTPGFQMQLDQGLSVKCEYSVSDASAPQDISVTILDSQSNLLAAFPRTNDTAVTVSTYQRFVGPHVLLIVHIPNLTCDNEGQYTCRVTDKRVGMVSVTNETHFSHCRTQNSSGADGLGQHRRERRFVDTGLDSPYLRIALVCVVVVAAFFGGVCSCGVGCLL
ncbi:hypothetical protein BaRGS_00033488 [Batillaria attramentaria]|uniref:Ig-like domain-containing protein n=1 Tax=Batillaria attramentaria TaxID=370345 RepID=A0ABD0JK10_9CAEN